MYQHQHHHMWRHQRRYVRVPYRHVRRLPPPLIVLLGLAGLGVAMVIVTALMALLVAGAFVLVPVLVAGLVVRAGIRSRSRPVIAPARRPAPVALAPPADPWPVAKRDFAALRHAYAQYECDPLAVLRLPALADVTVPSTARFIEAFAEAQALDTDAPPPPQHRAQCLAAVDRACRAWHAAREAAERIQSSHLPEKERATVERVVRLLTTARDSDNDAERLVAYAKARSELARLERTGRFRLPRPAQAMLDTASRGALPPPPTP
jgi:hypothetical protein